MPWRALCRTVKQLLDTIEQARAGDFAEPQPARLQASPSAAPSPPSPSLEAPRKQVPADSGGSLQPMRPAQAMASAKPGSAALGSISLTNGSSSVPSWMGAPSALGGGSAVGTAYSQAGGNAFSSNSMATAGVLSVFDMYQLLAYHGLQMFHVRSSAWAWVAAWAALDGLCAVRVILQALLF